MEFRNVSLAAGKKQILHRVSGAFPAAKLTAVLGASGSGKSSLLGTLAFADRAQAQGYIILSPASAKPPAAEFVHQDDALPGELTVLETLELAARIIGRPLSDVAGIVEQLNLGACLRTRIGTPTQRGVSGGERKRVSIAKALLASPAYLFMDEPTSGLDSASAILLMKLLNHLCASKRMTIIASVHQPPKAAFDECACVAIMHRGHLVFCESSKIQEKFELKFGIDFPLYDNIADVMVQTVAQLADPASVSGYADIAPAQGLVTQSVFARQVQGPAPCVQVYWLVRRSLLQKSRNATQVAIPASNAAGFGLLLGGIYFGTFQTFTQAAMQNWVGLCFFVCLNQAFAGAKTSTDVFPAERVVVRRERRYYSPGTYLASSIATSWLVTVWWPLLFACVVFPMAGELDGPRLGATVLVVTLGYMAHSAFGMLIGAFSASAIAAADVSSSFTLVTVLFSGFYAQTDLIPAVLAWIQFVSMLRYMFGGVVSNEFRGAVFSCQGFNSTGAERPTSASSVGCVPTGEAMLERMGLQGDSWQVSAAALCGFAGVFYGLTWLRLWYTQ